MNYGRCSYPALCPLGLSINVVSPGHDHVARHISAPFHSNGIYVRKQFSKETTQCITYYTKGSSKGFTM